VLGTVLTVNPSLYKRLPDPDNDFRPIAIATTGGNMLVVHPSVPVNSVAEFVAFAKVPRRGNNRLAMTAGALETPVIWRWRTRLHARV
jgi:tripartite-type tricarboxylate transporter receptor subunit TctC